MKRLAIPSLLTFLLFLAPPASAQSSQNAMQEITKSIFYGGVAGLAVGGVVLVANGGNNIGDVLRWSFVTGALVGLGYGIYQVGKGGDAYGLLDLEEGSLALRAPIPELTPDGARVRLFAAHF